MTSFPLGILTRAGRATDFRKKTWHGHPGRGCGQSARDACSQGLRLNRGLADIRSLMSRRFVAADPVCASTASRKASLREIADFRRRSLRQPALIPVSFRGATGDEESRTALKTLRARFLPFAPLWVGMTARWRLSHRLPWGRGWAVERRHHDTTRREVCATPVLLEPLEGKRDCTHRLVCQRLREFQSIFAVCKDHYG